MEKELDQSDISHIKKSESFDKINEMADVFLKLANIVQHPLLTLVPSTSYTLNLKALIKVSKVS